MGDRQDPKPRAAADRDAALPAAAAGCARAHRGAAPAQGGRTAAPAPGELARQGNRRAQLQGKSYNTYVQ